MVVGALEEILGEPNALWDLLSVPLDSGRPIGRAETTRPVGLPPTVSEAIAELGLIEVELDEVSIHTTVDVGPDRCIRSVNSKQVVRARRAGARRMVVGLTRYRTVDESQPITAIYGCSVGRRLVRSEERIVVAELILSRPLARNSTALYEVQSDLAPYPVEGDGYWTVTFGGRVAQAIIEVRFDPDELPHAGEAFTVGEDGAETQATPRAVHNHLHNMVHDFGPGKLGVRWWWS